MLYTDDKYISAAIFKRSPDSHKGDFGKLLIFAGSEGMAGAAVLAGRAALKSGAGLVRFLLPNFSSSLLPILQINVPEATCICWHEHLNLSEYAAIAAGSGLGKSHEVLTILTYIIDNYAGILLLDADALNLISENAALADKVRNSKATIIITPHVGEAKRLLHTCEGIAGLDSRKNAVCALSEQYNCIAILKGSGTLVAQKNSTSGSNISHAPAFDIYQNTTGNPGMATGGSGDSLTGIISSLAAQNYKPIDAARIGVFIHGKAGDLASEQLGEMGMTAGDIVSYIPYALKLSSDK